MRFPVKTSEKRANFSSASKRAFIKIDIASGWIGYCHKVREYQLRPGCKVRVREIRNHLESGVTEYRMMAECVFIFNLGTLFPNASSSILRFRLKKGSSFTFVVVLCSPKKKSKIVYYVTSM